MKTKLLNSSSYSRPEVIYAMNSIAPLITRLVAKFSIILCMSCNLINLVWADDVSVIGKTSTHRFFPNSQINKSNIAELVPLWSRFGNDMVNGDTTQVAPLLIGGKLISVSPRGKLRAMNIETGELLYSKQLLEPLGRRGFNSIAVNDEGGVKEYILIPSGEFVLKIDVLDGSVSQIYETGYSLLAPFIYDGNLLVATLKDGIKSFDFSTGLENWHLSLNKNGVQSRIWSGVAFDDISGTLFVVTSNPGNIVGVGRGNDDYSVSLLAVTAETGEVKWQFKHIKNDLWDLDLAGPPIIIDLPNSPSRAVLSVSKTGDVIYLDLENGRPVFPDSIAMVEVESSDVDGVIAAKTQLLISKPEAFAGIDVDLVKDFNHLDDENREFVQNKTRHSRSGFFIPPSVNYDVVMFGIHGGADWPGATYAPTSHSMVVPYNRSPFILRLFYQDTNYYYLKKLLLLVYDGCNFILRKINKLIFKLKVWLGFSLDADEIAEAREAVNDKRTSRWSLLEWVERDPPRKLANKLYPFMPYAHNNKNYYEKCSSCHGNARQGDYQSELWGDGFYPPLVGVTLTEKWRLIDTAEKVNRIHSKAGYNIDVSEDMYASMMGYFNNFDLKLKTSEKLDINGFWQLLLDKEGFPATSPPWGGLAKIDLHKGQKVWDVPLGIRRDNFSEGDINFGGVVTTDSGLVFATGTPDEFIYAHDLKSGKLLWKGSLPFAGSAPPTLIKHRGCDLLIVTATGGRFVGYSHNGDSLVAFKTRECVFN